MLRQATATLARLATTSADDAQAVLGNARRALRVASAGGPGSCAERSTTSRPSSRSPPLSPRRPALDSRASCPTRPPAWSVCTSVTPAPSCAAGSASPSNSATRPRSSTTPTASSSTTPSSKGTRPTPRNRPPGHRPHHPPGRQTTTHSRRRPRLRPGPLRRRPARPRRAGHRDPPQGSTRPDPTSPPAPTIISRPAQVAHRLRRGASPTSSADPAGTAPYWMASKGPGPDAGTGYSPTTSPRSAPSRHDRQPPPADPDNPPSAQQTRHQPHLLLQVQVTTRHWG